jgi:hypothetical protein
LSEKAGGWVRLADWEQKINAEGAEGAEEEKEMRAGLKEGAKTVARRDGSYLGAVADRRYIPAPGN